MKLMALIGITIVLIMLLPGCTTLNKVKDVYKENCVTNISERTVTCERDGKSITFEI